MLSLRRLTGVKLHLFLNVTEEVHLVFCLQRAATSSLCPLLGREVRVKKLRPNHAESSVSRKAATWLSRVHGLVSI